MGLKDRKKRDAHFQQAGFSLLELIIVLGVISILAGVILPNLNFSSGSQMSLSLRNITSVVRGTFDNAIFTGKTHRLVFDLRSGAYWTEQAPSGYTQRPPVEERDERIRDELKNLVDKATEQLATQRPLPSSTEDHRENYTVRSFIVQQKKALEIVKWKELNEALLFRQKLSGDVVFTSFVTDIMRTRLEPSSSSLELNLKGDQDEKDYGYIYFFPTGLCNQAVIQLGIKGEENAGTSMQTTHNFTIEVNSFTGRSTLFEGFHDAEFSTRTP